MAVTFPHMGKTYLPLKVLFEELHVETVIPPKCSKATLELGTKYAPEQICLPFKINLGNFIESIAQGADTIYMLGGCDVCRFGLYHSLHKEILQDLGYHVQVICIEPFSNLHDLTDFVAKLAQTAHTKNYCTVLTAVRKAIKTLFMLDQLDHVFNRVRARELRRGETDHLYAAFERNMLQARGYGETREIIGETSRKLLEIKTDCRREALRIGIVGEIYTIVEPYVNLHLEQKLGRMGVEVYRSISSSDFLKEELDFLPFVHSAKRAIRRAAQPYLDRQIGGHARHTVGNAVRLAANNFDGLIHLYPLTCMPEIVAKSILPKISKEKNIPVLTLVVDEMTGEGGYLTRVEAFVDALACKTGGKSTRPVPLP